MLIINRNKFETLCETAQYVFGSLPIIIGLDKFAFFIVNWNLYVSRFVATNIITPTYLILGLGIIEIVIGILILTKFPRLGAYFMAGLMSIIMINLLMIGNMYDIILRDIGLAFGYIMFAILTEIKETARPA